MRAIRVLVADPYMFQNGGIAIRIAMQDIDDTKGWATRTVAVLEQSESGSFWQWRYLTDEDRFTAPDPATDRSLLSFPEGIGEALLEGLSRHYHGGPAPDRQQRADFERERERRDILEDRLASVLDEVIGRIREPTGPTFLTPHHPELIFHTIGTGCLGHMSYDYDAARCPNAR